MLRNRISLLLILAILFSLALPVLGAGTPTVRIEAPETVQAALSDIQARLIVSRRSFFATLRQKQRVWSEEEEQE